MLLTEPFEADALKCVFIYLFIYLKLIEIASSVLVLAKRMHAMVKQIELDRVYPISAPTNRSGIVWPTA
jgi:hypothetical protein